MANASASGYGIAVAVAGLYLVTASVYWQKYTVGVSVFNPPASNLRVTAIRKNGVATTAILANTATQSAPDSTSTVLRLAAGDIITLYATNLDAASTGNIGQALLTVTKLAP
jgi:hypothetical protein